MAEPVAAGVTVAELHERLIGGRPLRPPAADPVQAELTAYLASLSPVQRDAVLYWMCGYAQHAVRRALTDLRPVPVRRPSPGAHRRWRSP